MINYEIGCKRRTKFPIVPISSNFIKKNGINYALMMVCIPRTFPFSCLMNKIACFLSVLLVSFAFLLECPVISFSQTQSGSQTPSARPVPPTAVRGSRQVAPAQSNAKDASPDQTLGLTLYNCGNPSNEEQYMLEMINHAAAHADSEGIYLSTDSDAGVILGYNDLGPPTRSQVATDFATYPVRPPLAFNADLRKSALVHDGVMLALDSQYHFLLNSDSLEYPQDGGYLGPGGRIDNAGYTNWMSWGENVFDYGTDMDDINASFLVDWGNPDLGHRHNIMNFGATDYVWNEVGIGMLDTGGGYPNVGPILTTEDFG